MNEQTLDPSIFGEMRNLMDDALGEFITTYLDNSPLLIGKIEQGLNAQNSTEIFHNAHQLKGGSGSIGATKLADIATSMEQIARKGSIEGVEPLLVQLKQEFEQVAEALKAEL